MEHLTQEEFIVAFELEEKKEAHVNRTYRVFETDHNDTTLKNIIENTFDTLKIKNK